VNERIKRLGVIGLNLLLSAQAFAGQPPIAGEVIEGSLKGKTLIFTSHGGIYQAGQMAALKYFVEKSGVRLIGDGPTEMAKLQAQVASNNVVWDVVDTSDFAPHVYCGTLFQKLDYSRLDISNLTAGQAAPCGVPSMNYGIVLMVKNSSYPNNPPKNWRDFFDTDNFPGIRGLDDHGEIRGGIIEQAILAAGGSVENLKLTDIDLGLNKIRQLGADTVFWKTGAESQQLAEAGEVDMIMMWTGRAMAAVKNGADYSPVWQDWLVVMDYLTIPMGAKNVEGSYALINAYLGKEAQEIMTEQTAYTPVHKEARPKLDEITAAFMVNTPERIKQGYQWNIPFWTEHFQITSEKWAALSAGY